MKLMKPANDLLVIHDPRTGKRVPMEGVVVDERDPFWRRRLAEKSMTAEAAPPKAPKLKSAAAVPAVPADPAAPLPLPPRAAAKKE